MLSRAGKQIYIKPSASKDVLSLLSEVVSKYYNDEFVTCHSKYLEDDNDSDKLINIINQSDDSSLNESLCTTISK